VSPVVIGSATLYLGDCMEILPTLPKVDALVTDPPYPNNAGHFDDDVETAREVIRSGEWTEGVIFWNELDRPPFSAHLVAVHIWHRTNVNGRPYEPAFQFHEDGIKRRSEVYEHAAIHGGVGPGSFEYEGHPTQKPAAIMAKLISKTSGVVLDPFMGSGSTGVACAFLRRPFIGIERDPKYFEIACRRIEDAQRQAPLIPHEQPKQEQPSPMEELILLLHPQPLVRIIEGDDPEWSAWAPTVADAVGLV
jgi:DNA modification methylase